MSKRTKKLRSQIDDSFVSGGHQIVKARQYTRKTPEWVNSEIKIRALLLRVFPKLHTEPKQRERAARWGRIIQLYFRTGYTHTQVAHEMRLTADQVRSTIRAIRRAAAGQRADGSGPRSGKRGRPKRKTNAPQS